MSDTKPYKPILCVDFDGVIHSYASGWQGIDVIPDPPVDGFFEWAIAAAKFFRLCVYSSRSRSEDGLRAMENWLDDRFQEWVAADPLRTLDMFPDVEFSATKPAAFMTIDDRGFRFEGVWPDPAELLKFKPWNKQ